MQKWCDNVVFGHAIMILISMSSTNYEMNLYVVQLVLAKNPLLVRGASRSLRYLGTTVWVDLSG